MGRTELKYRTFDELLSEVSTDLRVYANEGMIEPAQLIKVAQKISSELGLKIHTTKEKVLEINHGHAKLPDDFYTINMALTCVRTKIIQPFLSGLVREDIIVDPSECSPAVDPCNKCGQTVECFCQKTYSVCENTCVKVIEKSQFITREYEHFHRLYIVPSKQVEPGNPFKRNECVGTAEVKNGYLYVHGIDCGYVYISYQAALEDEEGNLLVIDHPIINEYYEYALKQRILENLYLNGEDVSQRISLIEPRYRAARNNAMSLVNTPDFQQMFEAWKNNRARMHQRYYEPFRSYFY